MMNGHGDDERRELARLFDEQDKLLAEAKAEREYKELTRRVGESGLAFRDQEPESEINWDGWERWRSGHETGAVETGCSLMDGTISILGGPVISFGTGPQSTYRRIAASNLPGGGLRGTPNAADLFRTLVARITSVWLPIPD